MANQFEKLLKDYYPNYETQNPIRVISFHDINRNPNHYIITMKEAFSEPHDRKAFYELINALNGKVLSDRTMEMNSYTIYLPNDEDIYLFSRVPSIEGFGQIEF